MNRAKNFKKLLTVLMAVVLCFSVFAFAACSSKKPTTESDPTLAEDAVVDKIVTNGSFYNVSGTTFPKTATSWTGAAGSTATDGATPSGSTNLIAGVIDARPNAYEESKNIWDDLDNPSINSRAEIGDGNMLMIYNKVNTAYRFTNTTTSLDAGNYYKLSVDVKTVNLSGEAGMGAYIYFSNGIEVSFEAINTNGEWITYETYVESSLIDAKSVTITLALGYGSSNDGKLTAGYAFFDSVTAERVSEKTYSDAIKNLSSTVKSYSMRFTNGSMEYKTGSSAAYSPTGYSTLSGSGAGGTASTTSSYTLRGIVDLINDKEATAITSAKAILPNPYADAGDNFALLIRNKKYLENGTAAGYTSSSFRVPMGQIAKVTLWVNVLIENTDYDPTNTDNKRGAVIKFQGDQEIVTAPFSTTSIDAEGTRTSEWRQMEFYLFGSANTHYDYKIEMWLGQGGKDDKDQHVIGTALFDNITVDYYSSDAYDYDTIQCDGKVKCADVNNLIDNGNFSDGLSDWNFAGVGDVNITEGDTEYFTLSKDELDNDERMKELGLYDADNPIGYPAAAQAPILMINNKVPTAFGMTLASDNNPLVITKNGYYKMTLWIKTKDIDSSKGATINMFTKDDKDVETSLQTFSNVNTSGFYNSTTSGYREYTVYFEGNELKDNEFFIRIQLGDGTAINPTNYLTGYIFISSVRYNKITYNEYTNATTGTYIIKKSLAESDATISNGRMDKLDRKESSYDEQGNLTEAGVPSSLTKIGGDFDYVNSGIINVENNALLTKYGLSNTEFYQGWGQNRDIAHPITGHIIYGGKPNILMLQSQQAKEQTEDADEGEDIYNGKLAKAVGYKSSSISLSSSSYYILTVDVMTLPGTVASIYVAPTTNTNTMSVTNIDTNGTWEQYAFAIEVGLSSISIEISMYLGSTSTATEVSGTAFFDNLNYTKYDTLAAFDTATAEYDNATEGTFNSATFVVDSFDRTSSSTPLERPYTSNWTGAIGGSNDSSGKAPNGTSNQLIGVINEDADLSNTGISVDGTIKDGSDIEIDIDNSEKVSILSILSETDKIITGSNVLMINNKVSSAYSYKTNSSRTFSAGKYYEISVWVNTYLIENGGATVMLHVDTDVFPFKNIKTNEGDSLGEWTQYSFYVQNSKSSSIYSVYLTLALGRYLSNSKTEEYVQGYAFFDNMIIREITSEVYTEKTEGIVPREVEGYNTPKSISADGTTWKIKFEQGDTSSEAEPGEGETPEEPVTPTPSEFPWLLVSSLVIGAVLIAAIVAVLIRNYKKRPKAPAPKPAHDKRNKGSSNKKHDEYDEYSDK